MTAFSCEVTLLGWGKHDSGSDRKRYLVYELLSGGTASSDYRKAARSVFADGTSQARRGVSTVVLQQRGKKPSANSPFLWSGAN